MMKNLVAGSLLLFCLPASAETGIPSAENATKAPAAENLTPVAADDGQARANADQTGAEVGFAPLFDGETLSGWRGRAFDNSNAAKGKTEAELAEARAAANTSRDQHWAVRDAALVFDGAGGSLETERDYADFELRLEWKIEAGGDSGLYLRGIPQVQFWDPANEGQRRHGNQHGSAGLWNNPEDQGKFPLVVADRPVGEWNALRVRMTGAQVSIWLNDQLVVDNQTLLNNWDRNQPLPERGPIVLQAHGHRVAFRNLWVKEL